MCPINRGTFWPYFNRAHYNIQNDIIAERAKTQHWRKPMTICIAINCECDKKADSQRVIMVADRMITSEYLEIEFEHPKPKLMPVTQNCVVAISGNALLPTEVFDHVKQKLKITKNEPQISEIASTIKDAYAELRHKKIEDHILKPMGISSIEAFYKCQSFMNPEIVAKTFEEIKKYDYGLQLLIGGVDNTGAHIFAIDNPGVSFNLNDLGYDAIGSGENHAILTFIGANYHSNTTLEVALYLAYKAKKISEKAPGIGVKYTDIWVIENDAIYEIPQGDEKNVTGIKKLEMMYNTELKQTDVPLEQLIEIIKAKIKRTDLDILRGYA